VSEGRAKTVLLLGAGGLGAPAALALAGSGVERLVVADATPLDPTDLPLLPHLGEADVGQPRAGLLAKVLARLAPGLLVEPVTTPLSFEAGQALALRAGVVVDATDRFAGMFLANDAAAGAGVPLVHGGLLHHTVQLLSVVPGQSGCLRCLFEAPPATGPLPPLEPGVLGPLAGLAGSLLGAEAMRLLAGVPGVYAGRLVSWEARSGWSRAVPVKPRPGCPACDQTQTRAQATSAAPTQATGGAP